MQEKERFEEITVVSRGAFCLVLKARRHGRLWALKTLRPECRNAGYSALLRKEFDILISMEHSGIARGVAFEEVEDLGECIVMEWVDGTTLKEWLVTPHPHKERRRVARELTDILRYVHDKGAVHRDLKPSNIMLTRSGAKVKLIDFGLSDTDDYAIYKSPAGSKFYISPEQRNTHLTDVRNDLYSLGCLLADLQLGAAYAPIVRKCKAIAGKRYTNIEEVQQAFRRIQTIKHMGIAFVLLALIVGSIALFFNSKPSTDPVLYAAVDSISRNVNREQTRIDSVRLVINSLRKNVDISQEKLRRQKAREQLLLAITKRAKAQMDTMMHYDLDTLNEEEACGEVFHSHSKRLTRFAYSDEWAAPHRLSEAEKANITRELYWNHRMNLIRQLQQRFLELRRANEARKAKAE